MAASEVVIEREQGCARSLGDREVERVVHRQAVLPSQHQGAQAEWATGLDELDADRLGLHQRLQGALVAGVTPDPAVTVPGPQERGSKQFELPCRCTVEDIVDPRRALLDQHTSEKDGSIDDSRGHSDASSPGPA